jgi:hypothetical protein
VENFNRSRQLNLVKQGAIENRFETLLTRQMEDNVITKEKLEEFFTKLDEIRSNTSFIQKQHSIEFGIESFTGLQGEGSSRSLLGKPSPSTTSTFDQITGSSTEPSTDGIPKGLMKKVKPVIKMGFYLRVPFFRK